MYKIYIVLLLFLLPAVSQAQSTHYDTLFSVRQESIPLNDSGGRWLPSALDITSVSAYPQHVQIYTLGIVLDYGLYDRDSVWKLPDSAYYLADSIFIYYSSYWVRSGDPLKYIDSSFTNTSVQLDFLLPAHGTIRVPIGVRAITQNGIPGDTVSHVIQVISYSDSAGKTRGFGYNFDLRCMTMYSAPYGIWQQSFPPNDSGGRWLQSWIVMKSISPYASHLSFPTIISNLASDTVLKIADSALYLADSIYVYENGYFNYIAGSPWKYIDSLHRSVNDNRRFSASLDILLAPHATLYIPIWIRAWGQPTYYNDTVFHYFNIQSHSDVNGVRQYWGQNVTFGCIPACSGPYVEYSGVLLSNKDNPVTIGQSPFFFPNQCINCGSIFPTTVSYKMAGEYSDRFQLPDSNAPTESIAFLGAAKSPIHDTLFAIYTDCWGSISTKTPITAYSTYADGYQIRPLSPDLKAPFLGRADGNAATVYNTSDFPITLRNLQVFSYYDSLDFEVSGPAMIAAHDSGYLSVTLKDRNLYLDTSGTSRSATITGIIAPYQQQLDFKDSTFSVSVSGSIDVYSPLYFSLIPVLKHGVHPAGIIFTSSVSSLSGPGTFLTVYGNNDSTTEYFGMPYYDDPHFTFAIGDYLGFGTVTLPGNVNPDTGFFSPGIQVLTTFTGDSYQNYYTQMHWPRATDTVTIDVVALGENAPHFEGVAQPSEPRPVSLWPNPASSILHIRSDDPTASFSITDILGRKIRTGKGIESSIDISDLPNGLYVVSFSKLGESLKFQVLR